MADVECRAHLVCNHMPNILAALQSAAPVLESMTTQNASGHIKDIHPVRLLV